MTTFPRIDFYVLQKQSPNGQLQLACRIVEKAYQARHQIYLRTRNLDDASLLDDLLWTFSQSSFVPHQLNDDRGSVASPVVIGVELPMENNIDILISLSEEPIVDFTSYPRIAEIVGFEEKEKESGRARFRYYKNHGIRLNTHHIKL